MVRVDYNVPVKDGLVTDTLRIVAGKPTLDYLLAEGCSLVLISHLGEPKEGFEDKFSLAPVAKAAREVLGREVRFIADCLGDEAATAASGLKPGEIILLENLRFHPEETANDGEFAKALASYGDIYVNDAFAADHRSHASLVAITQFLPSVAGLLVEKEVQLITAAIDNPTRPLVAIIGGAKIDSKIEVIKNLIPRVNALFIGGAMANTFLAAQGFAVGKSLYEADELEVAKDIMGQASLAEIQFLLPIDVVVTDNLETASNVRTVLAQNVGENDIIADLGPDSVAQLAELLSQKGTVIWNGPLGITETLEFASGSAAMGKLIIDSGVTSIIGGGDTAGYIDGAGLHDKFSLVSTGGGASLELMSGKKLPGVEALLDL